MDPQAAGDQAQQPPPPTLTHPRFTLELEFVSSLANPYYLSHLAVNYPNLLGINKSGDDSDLNSSGDPDAQAFAAYLAYLYSYWKTPEYAQFLTHPGATLRALRLLQEDTFRRDIIRPQVIEGLAGTGIDTDQGGMAAEPTNAGEVEGEQTKGNADQPDGSTKT
ncbi:SOH1-domain-containing protein [Aspergillus ambiguus]|uniref:mediator of RNA polymerase II transcription subunit 31 n=1 Tax=Aspergillus ambiguus TaxID=176160 RepID=UPI003CCE4DDA